MIKSMTGYGRAQKLIDGRDISVEIKSVNHRFFEFSCRSPRAYGYIEDKLKALVYGGVSRGKIDVSVNIVTIDGGAAQVEINHDLARSYLEALRNLGSGLGLADDITLSGLARFSDIFIVRKSPEDEDAVWSAVSTVAKEALDSFIAMREAEGASLKSDMLSRLEQLDSYRLKVEERSPVTVEEYRARLYAKLSEVLADRQLDDARVLTEAAIFSERVAVAEETVRLGSHIAQLRDIMGQDEAVGRKLDFLVQELNRETNTIGSKAQDKEIARIVIEMKSEIEKIREQIQNIE